MFERKGKVLEIRFSNALSFLLLVKLLSKTLLYIWKSLITAKTTIHLYKALRLQLVHHYLDIDGAKQIDSQEKERIAPKLFQIYCWNKNVDLASQKPLFPEILAQTKLFDLIGDRSILLFKRMKFSIEDVQFLRYSTPKWSEFSYFQLLKRTMLPLKVVNDAAKRGIRLLEKYKYKICQERNVIMKCVENSRKRMLDLKKTFLVFLHLPVCDFLLMQQSLV